MAGQKISNVNDIEKIINNVLDKQKLETKLFIGVNERSFAVKKLNEISSETNKTKVIIFKIETKRSRKYVLADVESQLKLSKIKYDEIQGERVNKLEIDVQYGKKVRIIFKPNSQDLLKLKNEWYNERLKNLYGQNEITKMTPNDRNELQVLKEINSAIQEPTILKIGNKTYKNVIGLVGVPGNPKADFVIVDEDKKELCWISYKSGNDSKSFQQYSGISKSKSSELYSDKEIESFRKDVVEKYSKNPSDIGKGVYRKIKEPDLKRRAIYGKDYKKTMGKDNVTFFAQGSPKIKIGRDNSIRLDFGTKLVRNGVLNSLTEDYEPVIGARKDSNRNIQYDTEDLSSKEVKKTLPGVRGGIFTKKYMESRGSRNI